jgi:hypothetical protein
MNFCDIKLRGNIIKVKNDYIGDDDSNDNFVNNNSGNNNNNTKEKNKLGTFYFVM